MYQSHTEIDAENYENYKIEDKTIKKKQQKIKKTHWNKFPDIDINEHEIEVSSYISRATIIILRRRGVFRFWRRHNKRASEPGKTNSKPSQ